MGQREKVAGYSDPAHVSTSYVERNNLKMRMQMRRFTRLTNAFSKKVKNHSYAVALHMMYYNFVRVHSKLPMSPAMVGGVSDRLWEVADIVALVDAEEAKSMPIKRGPYKKTSFLALEPTSPQRQFLRQKRERHLSETITIVWSADFETGRESMAERKSALNRAPPRPDLERLLERAKATKITEEMLREQRASFVYGNAPKGSRITKASAMSAVDRVRVTSADSD